VGVLSVKVGGIVDTFASVFLNAFLARYVLVHISSWPYHDLFMKS
jgi:hypothetical protein